jgi:hypothetical protein
MLQKNKIKDHWCNFAYILLIKNHVSAQDEQRPAKEELQIKAPYIRECSNIIYY